MWMPQVRRRCRTKDGQPQRRRSEAMKAVFAEASEKRHRGKRQRGTGQKQQVLELLESFLAAGTLTILQTLPCQLPEEEAQHDVPSYTALTLGSTWCRHSLCPSGDGRGVGAANMHGTGHQGGDVSEYTAMGLPPTPQKAPGHGPCRRAGAAWRCQPGLTQ